ncbi:MAG: hypothetical protein WDN67_04295 [Candidatus Moraniibacteriota bacterium]
MKKGMLTTVLLIICGVVIGVIFASNLSDRPRSKDLYGTGAPVSATDTFEDPCPPGNAAASSDPELDHGHAELCAGTP